LVKSTPFEEIAEDQQPFAWTYNQLSKKNRAFLDDLPQAMLLKYKGHRFLLTHGSPAANDDPIYEDTPDERLAELAGMTEAGFILCGHTHLPFIRQSGSQVFINPGSVGRMIDHDPRASYCVLDIHKNSVDVEFFRVEYNLQIALDGITAAGLPELYSRLMAGSLTLAEGQAAPRKEESK
jgi:putative phosphoesterase